MEISFICVVLFFKLIEVTGSIKCISETKNGSTVHECCADFEATEGSCIACSKGYTSYAGQKCQPCPKNTYGEKCSYDCSCLVDEICDNMQGCLKFRTSTEFPVHKFSDTTILSGSKNEMSSSGSIDNSDKGLVNTEVILYYIVSVIVLNMGVFVCFIFYKYKLSAKKKKPTII